MALELVTGYWDMEHVTAEQEADLNAGIVGSGNYVLPVGEKMRAEAVTSNKVRIFDGIFMTYGRQCYQESGDYEDVTIENGTAGLLRNDMIVVRYKKDEVTGIEKTEFAVLKGQTGEKAVDPVPNNQNIRTGTFESEIPMYRVCLNGLAIEKIEPLFSVTMTNKELAEKFDEVNSNFKALSTPTAGGLYSYNSNWEQNHGSYILDPLGVWVMGSYTAQANSNSIYLTGIPKKMKIGQVTGTAFINGDAKICRVENYNDTTVVIILNDNQPVGTIIQFNVFAPYITG